MASANMESTFHNSRLLISAKMDATKGNGKDVTRVMVGGSSVTSANAVRMTATENQHVAKSS
jgi:hypothetical protein